jgi:hypothetical protein
MRLAASILALIALPAAAQQPLPDTAELETELGRLVSIFSDRKSTRLNSGAL